MLQLYELANGNAICKGDNDDDEDDELLQVDGISFLTGLVKYVL